MVLGFKSQFKEPILSGLKLHTIRAGKRWRAQHSIQMATGVRTKFYSQFNKGRSDLEKCRSTQRIDIEVTEETQSLFPNYSITVLVDGRQLSNTEILKLAINDGFKSIDDFADWFKPGLKDGQIVHWTDLKY